MTQRALFPPPPKTETDFVGDALVELSALEFLVWRNNTGKLFETFPDREVPHLYRRGRLVSFGLKGSGDILGWCRVCGRFAGVEAKSEHGKRSPEQIRWANFLVRAGGIYAEARTLADLEPFRAHRRACVVPSNP